MSISVKDAKAAPKGLLTLSPAEPTPLELATTNAKQCIAELLEAQNALDEINAAHVAELKAIETKHASELKLATNKLKTCTEKASEAKAVHTKLTEERDELTKVDFGALARIIAPQPAPRPASEPAPTVPTSAAAVLRGRWGIYTPPPQQESKTRTNPNANSKTRPQPRSPQQLRVFQDVLDLTNRVKKLTIRDASINVYDAAVMLDAEEWELCNFGDGCSKSKADCPREHNAERAVVPVLHLVRLCHAGVINCGDASKITITFSSDRRKMISTVTYLASIGRKILSDVSDDDKMVALNSTEQIDRQSFFAACNAFDPDHPEIDSALVCIAARLLKALVQLGTVN